MVRFDLIYMAKSKVTKADYIEQLCDIVRKQATRLTVKQIRHLAAKYELD